MTNGIGQQVQAVEFENKVPELPSLDSVDQQMPATKKIEDLDMVSKKTEQPIDLIIMPLSEKQTISSEEAYIVTEVVKEDQVIEVPHIDFIIGD